MADFRNQHERYSVAGISNDDENNLAELVYRSEYELLK